MGISGQNHVPAALPPWKNTDIDWIGFWVGPGVSLDVLEEETLLPLSEFGGCRYIPYFSIDNARDIYT